MKKLCLFGRAQGGYRWVRKGKVWGLCSCSLWPLTLERGSSGPRLSKHSKPHKLVKGQSFVRFLTKQALLKAKFSSFLSTEHLPTGKKVKVINMTRSWHKPRDRCLRRLGLPPSEQISLSLHQGADHSCLAAVRKTAGAPPSAQGLCQQAAFLVGTSYLMSF